LRSLREQIEALRRLPGKNTPEFDTWEQNVKLVLADYYGFPSPAASAFDRIWFSPGAYYPGQPVAEFVEARERGLQEASGFIGSRIEEISDMLPGQPAILVPAVPSSSKSIFVVHGHDSGTKETVARFLTKIDLEPIILHEQADMGRTLIEKFEHHSSGASCAVILLTPDDECISSNKPEKRARQNVVFELGFFVGKLGRNRTFALKKSGVVLPSDMQGLIYIDLDSPDWMTKLAREFRAAGIPFDVAKVL
jgi:predicted nucleotide-binding protein